MADDLDEIDRKILDALQKNCRLSLAELAEMAGLSASPCLRRWRRLEKDGYIGGYCAMLDAKRLGLSVTAIVTVKLTPHTEAVFSKFERAMIKSPEVLECVAVAGARDYQLRVVARDLEAYEDFVRKCIVKIGDFASIETSFVLANVKSTTALPVRL